MKDLLVLYPHGLGDCILLTPALREFYKATGEKVHVATLSRFKSAEFFDNNPYVDKIFYTKDAWLDYPNSHIGFKSVYEDWKKIAKENNFNGLVMPMHSNPISKIQINFNKLGIKDPASVLTEIHTSDKDKEMAQAVIDDLVGSEPFGFIQTNTGVPAKDLPTGFGEQWLKKNRNLTRFIEIGKNLQPLDYNINIQFEILRQAEAVCVPDSVFYHACHALSKEVDFVYFGRGAGIHHRVKPLHRVVENVVYHLGDI